MIEKETASVVIFNLHTETRKGERRGNLVVTTEGAYG
jgi:hypothetical protein